MQRAVIARAGEPLDAEGTTFDVHAWAGSGPAALHVHHEDDEAWHVLEGELRFRFADGEQVAPAGSTVFVPAGVAHTFEAPPGCRYLVVFPPRVRSLVEALHGAGREQQREVYRAHASELLE